MFCLALPDLLLPFEFQYPSRGASLPTVSQAPTAIPSPAGADAVLVSLIRVHYFKEGL